MLHRHDDLMMDIAECRLPFASVPSEHSIVKNSTRLYLQDIFLILSFLQQKFVKYILLSRCSSSVIYFNIHHFIDKIYKTYISIYLNRYIDISMLCELYMCAYLLIYLYKYTYIGKERYL